MHIRKEAFWYRALASLYLSLTETSQFRAEFQFVGRADVPASVL